MALPYPTQTSINELLNRQEFRKALQQLETQFPNDNALQNLRGEANRIKNGRILGTMTLQEIAAEENKLSGRIREWMETIEDTEIKKIIVFFNNVPNGLDIKLSKEAGDIQKVFKDSKNTLYRLQVKFHLDYPAIIDSIIIEEPHLVQFSMHADGERGLVMISEDGNKSFINKVRFKDDMELIAKRGFLKGILLNGCYTQPMAESIKGIIPRIIATKESILDKAARIFSSAFYNSLLNYPDSTIDSSFGFAVKKLNDSADEDVKKNATIPVII